MAEREKLYVVFDGPPGFESGRFVELETVEGYGRKAGEWVQDVRPITSPHHTHDYWKLGPFYDAALIDAENKDAPANPDCDLTGGSEVGTKCLGCGRIYPAHAQVTTTILRCRNCPERMEKSEHLESGAQIIAHLQNRINFLEARHTEHQALYWKLMTFAVFLKRRRKLVRGCVYVKLLPVKSWKQLGSVSVSWNVT